MKIISLTNSDKKVLTDDEDYEKLSRYSWSIHQGYVAAKVQRKTVPIARLIMNAPKGMDVDHKNGDRLDNQKSNLRICTHQQNLQNTSKRRGMSSIYKGVHWKPSGTWRAATSKDGKKIHIGYFKEERHAAMAYDIWAKELFGEYAKLNFKPV